MPEIFLLTERLLILFALLGVLFFALILLGYFVMVWYRWRFREKKSLEFVLLQVAVPRSNEVKIDAMEQIFASLSSLRKGGRFTFLHSQEHISFEIVAKPQDIRFYISCSNELQDMVEKQIHGIFSGAQIEKVDEYNLFTKEGKVAFAELQLKSVNYHPIKTFRELPTDPLAAITSALAKMQVGESSAIQVVISPADSDWQKKGKAYISSTKKSEADPEKAKFSVDAKTLESIDNKCSKPGFETTIRIVTVSPTIEGAKAHLTTIKTAFQQFAGNLNGFSSRNTRADSWFINDFIYRYQPMFFLGRQKSILSSEELATIFHFPNRTIETPHLFWLNAKTAPAPQEIPTTGLYLGRSVYRGMSRPVYIQENDRRHHIYIIGKTGVGKSELLRDMILQDIRAGKGVCFIDPHDTIEKILPFIPPERANDVIYFYPGDWDRPMGLNLLEARSEQEQHFVATYIINLFYKLFDPYRTGIVGPRLEHGIRNAMLTVMSEPGNTFVEVMRCLTDSRYVQELLPKVNNPIVRRYWTDQIAQTADFHKSEVLDYTVSKFGRFVTNKMICNIIGQSKSAFDFRECMDQGKILLINLAKGEIGEENCAFLGLLLIPKILTAAMSRVDTPESQRRDFYLYVDEFQNFATPDFAQILSEARKFRLNLCVANQFIGQMEDEVKQAIFGNVGTMVSFRVGTNDAQYLQHEFAPVFTEEDLLNVEAYHAYIKTIVNNEPATPFSVDMTKDLVKEAALANPRVAQLIKEMSRVKYGRDRVAVEAEIVHRAKL